MTHDPPSGARARQAPPYTKYAAVAPHAVQDPAPSQALQFVPAPAAQQWPARHREFKHPAPTAHDPPSAMRGWHAPFDT